MALGYYSERISVARGEIQGLKTRERVSPPLVARPVAVEANLPVFDSATFTAELHSIAQDVGLPADEVMYVLESSAAQPYQRYRITMEAKAGYPELRKFIAALSSAQPNVTLDTLRCRRDDVAAVTLACQLAFSAFFRKTNDG